MKQVTLYGAEWCAYCHAARHWLDKNNVPYTYVDVDKEGRHAMHKAVPDNETIPVVTIGDESFVNPSYAVLKEKTSK